MLLGEASGPEEEDDEQQSEGVEVVLQQQSSDHELSGDEQQPTTDERPVTNDEMPSHEDNVSAACSSSASGPHRHIKTLRPGNSTRCPITTPIIIIINTTKLKAGPTVQPLATSSSLISNNHSPKRISSIISSTARARAITTIITRPMVSVRTITATPITRMAIRNNRGRRSVAEGLTATAATAIRTRTAVVRTATEEPTRGPTAATTTPETVDVIRPNRTASRRKYSTTVSHLIDSTFFGAKCGVLARCTIRLPFIWASPRTSLGSIGGFIRRFILFIIRASQLRNSW
jgi:hypothetical protein